MTTKQRLLAALLMALPVVAQAQSIPNGGAITQGQVWTPTQWGPGAWATKADTVNGVLTNATLINPTISGQIQPTFNVTSYGAKCDGQIIYGGVHTSSGSAVITTPTYSFQQSDVGATITLSVAPFNSYSSGTLPAFSSTIASVSGGAATMAAPSNFTSTGAGARWYHTVDTASIQAAMTAASTSNPGGGQIRFPSGVCVTKQLTLLPNDFIVGSSDGASIIMLANNSNSDMFVGQNFATLTGSNNTGGVKDWAFEDIQLDGNRGANTGSGIGTPTGTGHGIKVYGYEFILDKVLINNFAGDAVYTEWSNTAGSPADTNGNIGPDGMEAHIRDVKCAYGAGWCWVYNGPHDSHISYLTSLSMGTGGILEYGSDVNGSPLRIDHFHGYQEPVDLNLQTNTNCDLCFSEGTTVLNNFNYVIANSFFNILTLGTVSGPPVYNLQVSNTTVQNLTNVSGSGFDDTWVNSVINGFTGSYTPFESINNRGLTNNLSTPLQIYSGSSYPAIFDQSGGSVFTFTNGGAVQWTNNSTSTVFSNILQGKYLGVRPDLSGGTTWSSGQSAEGVSNLFVSGSATGTTGTGIDASINYFAISLDSLDCHLAAGNFCSGLELAHNIGTSSMKGSRNGLNIQLGQVSATGNTTNPGGSYVGAQFTVTAAANDNGTSGSGNGRGLLYGINPVAALKNSAATYFRQLTGDETDIYAVTGTSVEDKVGIQLVQTSQDAVKGSHDDVAFSINNQNSAVGWTYGLEFGRAGGNFPITSTGTMIYAQNPSGAGFSVANGIDWHLGTFSGNTWNDGHVVFNGIGQMTDTVNLTGSTLASASTIVQTANGSGTNGPATAQEGLSISVQKNTFPATTATTGEIDGLVVYGRQSGATSDMGGILVNIGNVGQGFLALSEGVASVFQSVSPFAATQQVNVQTGVLSPLTSAYYGTVYNAAVGTLTSAILVQATSTATGSWTDALQISANGTESFHIDGTGKITSITQPLANWELGTPASSSAACTTGDREADASFLYVCTATNTWKRAALSTF